MSREVVGLAGAVVVAAAALFYLVDVLRGGSRPHTGSWLVWTVVGVLGFATARDGGAGPGAYAAGVYVVAYTLTFLLSLRPRYGKPGVEWYDWPLCGVAVGAAVAWHLGTVSTGVATALAIATDGAGLWPTLREAWRDPSSESLVAWSGDATGNLLAVLALGTSGFAAAAYPVYLLGATLSVALVLAVRRRAPTAPAPSGA